MEVDKVVSAVGGALTALVTLGVLDGRPHHDRPGCIAALSAALAPELRNEVAAEKIRIVCREVEIR
jgi:hypothetical protein